MSNIFSLPVEIILICTQHYPSFMYFTSTCRKALKIREGKERHMEKIKQEWISEMEEENEKRQIETIQTVRRIDLIRWREARISILVDTIENEFAFVVRGSKISKRLEDYNHIEGFKSCVSIYGECYDKDYANAFGSIRFSSSLGEADTPEHLVDLIGKQSFGCFYAMRTSFVKDGRYIFDVAFQDPINVLTRMTTLPHLFGVFEIFSSITYEEVKDVCTDNIKTRNEDINFDCFDFSIFKEVMVDIYFKKDYDDTPVKIAVDRYNEELKSFVIPTIDF